MYKVLDKQFEEFDEVIEWAWNEHKIDWYCERDLAECEMQSACQQLEGLLKEGT